MYRLKAFNTWHRTYVKASIKELESFFLGYPEFHSHSVFSVLLDVIQHLIWHPSLNRFGESYACLLNTCAYIFDREPVADWPLIAVYVLNTILNRVKLSAGDDIPVITTARSFIKETLNVEALTRLSVFHHNLRKLEFLRGEHHKDRIDEIYRCIQCIDPKTGILEEVTANALLGKPTTMTPPELMPSFWLAELTALFHLADKDNEPASTDEDELSSVGSETAEEEESDYEETEPDEPDYEEDPDDYDPYIP